MSDGADGVSGKLINFKRVSRISPFSSNPIWYVGWTIQQQNQAIIMHAYICVLQMRFKSISIGLFMIINRIHNTHIHSVETRTNRKQIYFCVFSSFALFGFLLEVCSFFILFIFVHPFILWLWSSDEWSWNSR